MVIHRSGLNNEGATIHVKPLPLRQSCGATFLRTIRTPNLGAALRTGTGPLWWAAEDAKRLEMGEECMAEHRRNETAASRQCFMAPQQQSLLSPSLVAFFEQAIEQAAQRTLVFQPGIATSASAGEANHSLAVNDHDLRNV